MMTTKDLQDLVDKFDSGDMLGFTRKFLHDFEQAISKDIEIDEDQDWSGVICLGMGGSGAGGMFLSTMADFSGGIPFVVWNDYGLPSWWGPDWLVLATSYSGNTEETVDGIQEALEFGGTVVGISSGGKLEQIVTESEESFFISIPGGQMPRSAFGHLFGTQLAVCWSLGILEKPSDEEISNMIERLRKCFVDFDISGGNGLVISLAQSILDKEIGIIAPSILMPAARRFANQLNENSEVFARPSELPEMNHNEIIPWTSVDEGKNSMIYFSCENIHSRINSRMNWMLENIDNDNSWIIDCEGQSLLEILLYASHISDWISIALALIRGIDPSDMSSIVDLKLHLSRNQ